ncbi:MAG: alpha/beta hydrolase [Actinobacteria bacterium]|nr:alpha/beta hydrolase [Actinomycetota bacterium]
MKRDQPTPPLRADAFEVHRAAVGDGIELAYLHEGRGGLPVVLLHGWPGTKRLWWRNVEPLAAAGFEVIVPDQRGFGESTVPDGPHAYLDLPLAARDLRGLLDALGHERAVLVGGDQGCGVAQDAALRFSGLAIRQVLFNGTSPVLPELYRAHGIPSSQGEEIAAISDHKAIQGGEADALVERLGSDRGRIDYVKSFYQGRVWKEGEPPRNLAGPYSFDDAAAEFMAEPFGDPAVFRSSLGYYEAAERREYLSAPTMLDRVNEAVPTMILYGIEDEIVGPRFTARMEVAHAVRVGPFLVEEAGHFLQWERADVLNRAVAAFCADLL